MKKKLLLPMYQVFGFRDIIDFMPYMAYNLTNLRQEFFAIMWTVEYYRTESNFCPVKEFLELLPNGSLRAKAFRDIALLEKFGQAIREPYSKPIDDGLFELRIQFSKTKARIFFFFYSGKKIILTNGFLKTTSRTPKKEIEKAAGYRADYERRMKNELSRSSN